MEFPTIFHFLQKSSSRGSTGSMLHKKTANYFMASLGSGNDDVCTSSLYETYHQFLKWIAIIEFKVENLCTMKILFSCMKVVVEAELSFQWWRWSIEYHISKKHSVQYTTLMFNLPFHIHPLDACVDVHPQQTIANNIRNVKRDKFLQSSRHLLCFPRT